jgi:hypothetical protein
VWKVHSLLFNFQGLYWSIEFPGIQLTWKMQNSLSRNKRLNENVISSEWHCFGGKMKFQSDQQVCAVMSQASRLHASIALVMFLQHDWCYLGLQVERFTIRVMFTDWNPRNCVGPLISFLLLIVTNLKNIHLKQR